MRRTLVGVPAPERIICSVGRSYAPGCLDCRRSHQLRVGVRTGPVCAPLDSAGPAVRVGQFRTIGRLRKMVAAVKGQMRLIGLVAGISLACMGVAMDADSSVGPDAQAVRAGTSPDYGEGPPSVFGVDVPELAALGPLQVGVRTLTLMKAAQPDLLAMDPKTGTVPKEDRTLRVDVWYPAVNLPGARREKYSGSLPSEPPAPALPPSPCRVSRSGMPAPRGRPIRWSWSRTDTVTRPLP